jgi:predicted protein tyrosine phosphatase
LSDFWLLDAELPPDLAWIEPSFAIGGRPYPPQREAVRALGIDAIVTVETPLPNEASTWAELGVATVALATQDFEAIPFERFEVVTATVLAWLEARRTVLLHCLSGVNRAPTFAIALLCHRDGLSVDAALDRVRTARPQAAPTAPELASLRSWLALDGRQR